MCLCEISSSPLLYPLGTQDLGRPKAWTLTAYHYQLFYGVFQVVRTVVALDENPLDRDKGKWSLSRTTNKTMKELNSGWILQPETFPKGPFLSPSLSTCLNCQSHFLNPSQNPCLSSSPSPSLSHFPSTFRIPSLNSFLNFFPESFILDLP